MIRRQIIALGLKSIVSGLLVTLGSLKSTRLTAGYPPKIFESHSVDEILLELFDSNEAIQDGGIDITIPLEAEHNTFIPFKISAPGAEKIAVLVEKNPQPLVLTADLSARADGVIIGTLKMRHSSKVIFYVSRQAQLFSASRYVRLPLSGYDS